MKFSKQAIVASSLLFAVTGFAQMNLPKPQPSLGSGIAPEMAPPSASATQGSSGAAHAAPIASTASERSATPVGADNNKAEAEARNRLDAQKRALAPSAGVGARMETNMAVRR